MQTLLSNLCAQSWTVGDRTTLESGSGGEAFVAMVKPADLRSRHHLAAVRRLDGASIRAIFGERQMRPRAVVVVQVRDQDAAQMPFIKHDHMIQTLAANRADDPKSRADLSAVVVIGLVV